MQFSDTTVPAWLTLTDNGNGTATLSGTPSTPDVGSHGVVLTVNDGTANVQQAFTITVGAGGPSPLFSDTFSSTTLDSRWRFFDPVGDVTLSLTGTNAEFDIPTGTGHDLWKRSSNKAPRLLQPVTNVDFGVEVKFATVPSLQYQIQGLIIQQDDDSFLRFGTYHNGSALNLFVALIDGGTVDIFLNQALAAQDMPTYLRVERVGDTWSYSYSEDGVTWTSAANISQVLVPTEVGFYGGNAGPNPAYVASAEYFMDMSQPIASAGFNGKGLELVLNPAGEIPEEHALHQNYPNPFNPQTAISFGLSESVPVRLAVYDALGREVQVLVNDVMKAGRHVVMFDASKLSSGVYIYQLKLPGQEMTRRMILTK